MRYCLKVENFNLSAKEGDIVVGKQLKWSSIFSCMFRKSDSQVKERAGIFLLELLSVTENTNRVGKMC